MVSASLPSLAKRMSSARPGGRALAICLRASAESSQINILVVMECRLGPLTKGRKYTNLKRCVYAGYITSSLSYILVPKLV
ncbi:hypothetical protein MARHY2527 [Marinobacter nauticus ATCC 49840]|nr:hypothetical protein MARHY2527 [Marinobacter nauticus ATCC 49840]